MSRQPELRSSPVEPLRLTLQQPTVPAYRVPVFRDLSRRLGVPVRVLSYGDSSVPCAEADGFDVEPARARRLLGLRGHTLLWDSGQWRAASPVASRVSVFCWDIHYLSLVPSLLRARWNGLGTVLWGHGYSKSERVLVRRARDEVARLADSVVFYDARTAGEFARRTGHQGVFVAANCLDQRPVLAAAAHWRQRAEEARSLLATRGVCAPYLLFVSRLHPENRLEVMFYAQARLAREGRRIDSVIIGGGPDEHRLRALVADLKLEGRVHFLGSLYAELELAPWFMHALAFCYPSNVGLSLHHAFGYGLPLLAGDDLARHNPEISALDPMRNGLLFIHDDDQSLASSITRLIDDPKLRSSLGSGALRTVSTDFTLERMVDGLEAAVRYAYKARCG